MTSCPICLEPFFAAGNDTTPSEDAALGAVDPCGHIFHFQCFGLWKASQGSRCKCPECNQPAKKCIKLFGISPPEGNNGGGHSDDEDDLSLSSSEEEGGGSPPANDQKAQSSSTAAEVNTGDNDDDDESIVEVVQCIPSSARAIAAPGSIEVVDMTQPLSPPCSQPPRLPPTSTTKITSARKDQLSRYKRAAKKYKGLFKQKDSLCREINQQRQALMEVHATTKEENKQLRAEQDTRQQESELQYNKLVTANLKAVRLADDLKVAQSKIAALKRDRDLWSDRYKELEQSFKTAVQRVKTSDMAEVQQMMEERHKLLAENERLTLELRQSAATRRLPGYKNETAPSRGTNAPMPSYAVLPEKKRKAFNIAKGLRSMDDARFDPQSSSRSSSSKNAPSILPLKMSARSNSLMEMVRQQQQQQQKQHREKVNFHQHHQVQKARRISLDHSEESLSSRTSKPPALGIKISKSKHPFLKRR